jgi:hypothetical protein
MLDMVLTVDRAGIAKKVAELKSIGNIRAETGPTPPTMEQRQHPRFPVRFHSSFSSVNLVSGDGLVVDLSLQGCGILSSVDVLPGTMLELRMYLSSNEGPLAIGEAVVRWCRDSRVGLEFLTMQPGEWARLQNVVKELDCQPSERTGEDRQGTDT